MKSVLFVISSLALVALVYSSAHTQDTPNLQTTDVQIRKLQQDRVNVLQHAVELSSRRYVGGDVSFLTVLAMQHDLLDAQLDMADSREQRIRFLTQQLHLAKTTLALAKKRFESQLTSELDVHVAKSAALGVEIQLLKLQRPAKDENDR